MPRGKGTYGSKVGRPPKKKAPMKKKAAKIPYEGYTLPKSSEKGGQFIDFNKVLKPIKRVKKKR